MLRSPPTSKVESTAVCIEVMPPQCLSFDRVMEGRTVDSQSYLFALPIEILGQIMQYLFAGDLATLALVNSDCRQLARSQQFKAIRLDYSPNTWLLLEKLSSGALGQIQNPIPGSYPGSSIRHLKIATDSGWVEDCQQVNLQELRKHNKRFRRSAFKRPRWLISTSIFLLLKWYSFQELCRTLRF